MKTINFLLFVCLTASFLFVGCSDEAEEEILTRPLITFKDGIVETMESTYTVSASITSDQALKEVKIEKIFPGKEEPDEVIETITSFSDPALYVFEKEFTVPITVQKMQIKFHAITIHGLYSDEIFTFIAEQSAYSQSAIINALATVYAQYEATGELPDEVKVSGATLKKSAYYEAACRVLLQIQKGVDDPITLTGYPLPASPDADSFIEKEIPIELLFNQTTRQLNYAANNNVFANFVSYPQNFVGPGGEKYNGQFSFNRSAVVLTRALAYYKVNGSLPAKLSSSYLKASSGTPMGVWIWGNTLSDDNWEIVDKLASNHVDEVYLLVKGTAGTKTAANRLTDFIAKAHEKKIKVHFWYIVNEDGVYMAANPNASIYHCPKPGVDLEPYPMNDQRVNLLYPGYKEYVLDNIRSFVKDFDCDGVHLDYVRYGHFVYSFDPQSLERASSLGCNTTRLLAFFQTAADYKKYATDNGFVDLYKNNDQDVVKWVEMRKKVINEYIVAIKGVMDKEKSGLTLSASFMPDGITDPKYADVFYAQNYALNASVLDVISPMAYFKAYGKPTSWLKAITETAKTLVGNQCDIFTGIQGYDGVTADQLNEQIQFSISGGADGVVVFRYETIPADGWNVIKEWGK